MLQLNDKEAADLASYVRETQELLQASQAGQKPVLDKVAVDQTVAQLVKAGFYRPEDREKVASAIVQDPAQLLPILTKIAGRSQPGTVPALGKVASESKTPVTTTRESDRFFEGRFPAGR